MALVRKCTFFPSHVGFMDVRKYRAPTKLFFMFLCGLKSNDQSRLRVHVEEPEACTKQLRCDLTLTLRFDLERYRQFDNQQSVARSFFSQGVQLRRPNSGKFELCSVFRKRAITTCCRCTRKTSSPSTHRISRILLKRTSSKASLLNELPTRHFLKEQRNNET